MDMTQDQKAARTALMFDLGMRGVELPRSLAVTMLERPYAEWPEELKAKTGPMSRLVQAEDEKAAAPSPER